MGAAREKVRVARALEDLPKIAAAMGARALSYSKVREITRVATAPIPKITAVQIAEHGTATHVEKLVRAYRRCQEARGAARARRDSRQNRCVSYRYDDDGSLILHAGCRPRAGALRHREGTRVGGERTSRRETFQLERCGQRSVRYARAARMPSPWWPRASWRMAPWKRPAGGSPPDRGACRCGDPARRTAGCCEIEDGPSIAAETARRLACDASVVALIENDDGEPLNVGRKTRTISAPLRRMLNARDKGCRFPGCANSRYVDAHHIEHWANGGETKPSNLVSLCRFHHRAVHEGGVQIQVLDDGALRFVKLDG